MKYNKILKPKKFDNFTIIPSSIFRHKNITVGATGLFAYLFSHKAEQEITIQFICGHFKESKGAIGRKLNELIDAGYIVRERVTDKGKFKGSALTAWANNKGKDVKAVEINNDQIISCDYLICNSDPPNVYKNLIKSKNNYK